jgi:hypothetical protein
MPLIPEKDRVKIRENLRTYIEVNGISMAKISRCISEHKTLYGKEVSVDSIRRFLDSRKESPRVSDEIVAIILRYLEEHSDTGMPLPVTPAPMIVECPPGSGNEQPLRFFPVTMSYFDVDPQMLDRYSRAICGEYTFYACSEKDRSLVCQGAIRFSQHEGECLVEEVQESIPDGGVESFREEYTGHFFFREESMVVILREKELAIPKFYIMSVLRWKGATTGLYQQMEGAMLKVGEQKSLFAHNIYMVRNQRAFEECRMLELTELKEKKIAEFLGSRKWGTP